MAGTIGDTAEILLLIAGLFVLLFFLNWQF